MPTIKLSDGAEVFCREWLPERPNGEVVLCLHGVESHGGWFDEVAPFLTRSGFAVFAYDRPGWGQSPGPRGHLASYAVALRHLEDVANALRQKHARVHLAGLSWGGLLAAYAALRRGLLFDSVTLIAPGICPRQSLSAAGCARAALCGLARKWEGRVPLAIDPAAFTRRPDRARYILEDPLRVTAVTASFCMETLKMRRFCHERMARRGLPPTVLLLAQDDAIVDNVKTRALFLPAAAATSEEIPWAAHSLVFEAPERTAAAIVRAAATAAARRAGAPVANVSPNAPAAPKVAVFGAGAVGCFVGGLLALGGAPVTLVGREPLADALRERGLKLRLGGGERVVCDNLRAATALAPGEAPDLLLVTVKSFSLGPALEQIKAAVTPRTVIVSLQNGLDNELAIRTAFPDNPVLAGAICAYLDSPAPGEVVCADDQIGLGVGVFDGDREKLAQVAGWLRLSGMEVATALDGMALKWSKLVLNVAFNALNAATGLDAGAIMAHREYGPLAAAALKEAFAAMAAEGINPVDLPGYPVRKLRLLCRLPAAVVARGLARATRGATRTVSSMRQDLRRGRGLTEIQGINGAVVASAARHGIPAPANQRLVKMVEDAVARGLPHDADGGAA